MWQGRRVALVGLGKSNLAVARYLVRNGASVTGFDQKSAESLAERAEEARLLGIELVTGPSYLDCLRGFDTLFLTPGIKKSLPQIRRAESEGATLSSEINLVFDLCRAPIVGITGSAGKTTTVSLIGDILSRNPRRPAFVGGNIGNPLIDVIEDVPPHAVVVLELSSFQLQLLRKSPHIGGLLNISENHLDIHDSMVEYVESKKNVFRFGASDDWAVLNLDDGETRGMIKEAPAHVAVYSITEPVGLGASLNGDRIVFSSSGRTHDCGSIGSRLLPGRHNKGNILAAVCASMLAGAQPDDVALTVSTFRGVPHRLELVRTAGGVRFINDSIATAPDRTMAGLETIEGPIVLVAGGYDKGIGLGALGPAIARRAKGLVLLGATSDKIMAEVLAALREPGSHTLSPDAIRVATTMEEAVALATQMARHGDAVLLSPACASYDMFENFEERGNAFKRLVAALS